jgi:DNA-binding XRE family transcriptional regulator
VGGVMVGKSFKKVLLDALADPEVKREYETLETEFQLRRALIELRRRMNLSQDALAEKMGTKQEYISRVEQGHVDISITYLARYMKALNADMEITFKPKNGQEPIKTRVQI